MSGRLRNNYLHPNYNNYYESPWNTSLPVTNPSYRNSGSLSRRSRLFDQPYQPPPFSSCAVGLTEVLSTYTPGPTVIMIEKKRKPSVLQNKTIRLICFVLLALGIVFWFGTLFSSKCEFLTLSVPRIKVNATDMNENDNLTGYSYISPHNRYANVILSIDEDEESFVEEIQTYSILHY